MFCIINVWFVSLLVQHSKFYNTENILPSFYFVETAQKTKVIEIFKKLLLIDLDLVRLSAKDRTLHLCC